MLKVNRDGCALCRAGFKSPHGHISSLEEFRDILKRIIKEGKKNKD